MIRRLKTSGLVTLGLLMASMPMTAHAQGVSFDGNILWNNNGGGDQYDQSTFGGLSQSTETFVTSNFSDNDIVDPLLDPNYNVGVAGPWRPSAGSPALLANDPSVVKVTKLKYIKSCCC